MMSLVSARWLLLVVMVSRSIAEDVCNPKTVEHFCQCTSEWYDEVLEQCIPCGDCLEPECEDNLCRYYRPVISTPASDPSCPTTSDPQPCTGCLYSVLNIPFIVCLAGLVICVFIIITLIAVLLRRAGRETVTTDHLPTAAAGPDADPTGETTELNAMEA